MVPDILLPNFLHRYYKIKESGTAPSEDDVADKIIKPLSEEYNTLIFAK